MRHRDDDLQPFRDDPVVQALTGPGTNAELADEAAAVAAYRAAVPPKPQRRSAARVATTGVAAVLVLGVSGGAAAAYTSSLPDSWQAKLYNDLPSLHFPKPKSTPQRVVQPPPPAPLATAPTVPAAPSHAPSAVPSPHASPTSLPSSEAPAPSVSATVPVVVPTESPAPAATPTPTPSPSATSTAPPPAADGAQLAIGVSPGNRVMVGNGLTVSGKLTGADGKALADRRVVLAGRAAGQRWHRLAGARTSADGHVSFTVSALEHNVRLVLRAGRDRSEVVRVVVVPIISLNVAPTSPGATSTSVTLSVKGGEPGDVVGIRQVGGQSQRGTLDGSLTATFRVPVSQSQVVHYRAFVLRTKAHAAHSLAFYTPASG